MRVRHGVATGALVLVLLFAAGCPPRVRRPTPPEPAQLELRVGTIAGAAFVACLGPPLVGVSMRDGRKRLVYEVPGVRLHGGGDHETATVRCSHGRGDGRRARSVLILEIDERSVLCLAAVHRRTAPGVVESVPTWQRAEPCRRSGPDVRGLRRL